MNLGPGQHVADEPGLGIGVCLAVVLEADRQPVLERGVLGRRVGVSPQLVAERELLAEAL